MALRDDIHLYLNVRNTSAKWCDRAHQFLVDSIGAMEDSVDPEVVEWVATARGIVATKNTSERWAIVSAEHLQFASDFLLGIPDPDISYPDSPMAGTVGAAFGPYLPVNTGGYIVRFINQGGLPPGVVFDLDTGEISGTPTEAGVYASETRAVGVNGDSDLTTVDITIT